MPTLPCQKLGDEVCNGGDDDCNGGTDEDCAYSVTWQADPHGPRFVASTLPFSSAPPYVADVSFTGGTINHANVIHLSGVSNPAPAAVYQTARVGNFSYSIGGFGSMSSHTVRLHLCDTYFATAGSRKFNVSINGT